ncbi:hypothetical protein [Laspinema palackyanum]
MDPTLVWVTPGHPLDEVYDLLSGKVEDGSDRAGSLNWASN